MKSSKIKAALLILSIGAFLSSGCVNPSKIKELQNEISRLNQVIQQKDVKIKTLAEQAQLKEKDLDSIKKELDSSKKELDTTKKELDSVNRKLNTLMVTPAVVKK